MTDSTLSKDPDHMVASSDVPGWASSAEPTEPSPLKPKPGLTQMRA